MNVIFFSKISNLLNTSRTSSFSILFINSLILFYSSSKFPFKHSEQLSQYSILIFFYELVSLSLKYIPFILNSLFNIKLLNVSFHYLKPMFRVQYVDIFHRISFNKQNLFQIIYPSLFDFLDLPMQVKYFP